MPNNTPLEDRFWAKVDKRDDGCWLWTGALNNHGYGSFRGDGKTVAAHRLVWMWLVGPIPDGYVLDHDNVEYGCGNPRCVNPSHIEAVTQAVNRQRGRHLYSSNKSGHRGIRWRDDAKKWQVRVKLNGKEHSGGRYLALADAVAARDALQIQLYGDVMHEKEKTGGS